jgi:hypothetical protein
MKPSDDEFESLMELRRVSERFPTGEVKETVVVKEIWVPFSQKIGIFESNPNLLVCPLTSSRTEQLMREGKQTMRRKRHTVIEPYEQGME